MTDLVERLREATTPVVRAALFRSALLSLSPPRRPSNVARSCKVSGAMVSMVLQGKRVGGIKGRKVQDHVAELLAVEVEDLFPDRGPVTKGGGWHAQKRNQ